MIYVGNASEKLVIHLLILLDSNQIIFMGRIMNINEAAHVLDVRHTWKSSKIIYEVVRALQEVETRSILKLITKREEGILKDIATWCDARGHEIVNSVSEGGGNREDMATIIRKGEGVRRIEKVMTVILSTADLEHVVYPLDKALAGALLGVEMNVVLEGAGVRLLKRGYRLKLSGIIGRFFTTIVERVMKKEIGWPLPQETLRILEYLGSHFYVCGPSMVGYGVREEDLIIRNCTIAATITWADLLVRSDIHIFSKAQFEKP